MRDLLNKKSIRSSWLISYALIIFICLIALLSVILISRTTIKQEIEKNNSQTVSLATREFSQVKYDADNLSIKISTSSLITPFLENLKPNSYKAFSLKECITEISNMIIPYSFVEDVCIYNSSMDTFITLDGGFRANFEYENYIFDSISSENYEAWKTDIQKKRFHQLYLSENGKILHITSFSNEQSSNGSLIIISINPYALEQLISATNTSFEDVIILNHSNQPVFSQTNSIFHDMALTGKIDYDAVNKTYSHGGKDYIVYISPLDTSVKCLIAIAENAVYKRLNVFVAIIIFCLIPILFLIIWLVLFYAKKHYLPVENLLSILTNYRNDNTDENNEFAVIEGALNSLIDREKNSQRIAENYHKRLFEEDFLTYLKTSPCHRNLSDLFALYNISFSYNNYVVAIVSINNINEDIWEMNSVDSEESNEQLIPLAISNVYSEILGKDFEVLNIKTSVDTLFCFIGSTFTDKEEVLTQVHSRTNHASNIISEKIGVDIFVYLSDCFSDIDRTSIIYKQLNYIYTFEQISDKTDLRVLSFSDFKENTDILHFETNFEEEFEEHLVKALMSNDPDTSKDVIVQFLRNCGDSLTASHLIIIKRILLNKIMSNVRLSNVEITSEESYRLIEQINQISSVKQLHQTMFEVIDIIAKSSHTTDVTDLVKEYVLENFADVNLNVNMLGEIFNLTPPYLSRLFKQKTGEMLKDYIKKVRLTHARELLKTEMKIEDVAKNCGFVDSKLFIRIFKLYYNVSPGKYRKMYI